MHSLLLDAGVNEFLNHRDRARIGGVVGMGVVQQAVGWHACWDMAGAREADVFPLPRDKPISAFYLTVNATVSSAPLIIPIIPINQILKLENISFFFFSLPLS